MKRTILAVLALALAAPAFAFNPFEAAPRVLPAKHLPAENATTPLERRILVVRDSYDDALTQANVKAEAAVEEKLLGPTFDSWRERGAFVDYLRSDFFDLPADSSIGDAGHKQGPSYLWRNLGTYYPVVVCVGFNNSGGTTRRKFFNADSCTAKIVHVFGWGSRSTLADSTDGTVEMGNATLANGRYFDYRKGDGVRAYGSATTDTLWSAYAAFGRRSGTLPTGVAQVVRLFEPVLGSTYFGWGGDSVQQVFPALGDTVAKAGEVMPIAWRAYWTASGRSVDYVKLSGTAYTHSQGHILTAIVSRYAKIDPALAAVEFDDVFDANPTSATRMTNAAWDSVMNELRDQHGLKPVISVNPRHAAEYYAGTNPTRESAWASGAGWSWIRTHKIPWVHHSHDSTGADISSGLVGRFGGYSSENGSGDSTWNSGTSIRYVYSHRYGNAAVNGDAYTIKYRLQWSDSLRRVICPECFTPPYLSFPNNEMLPIDWRSSTGQSVASANRASFVSRWKSYQGDRLCNIDSLLLALSNGLNIPSGGTLYLRTGVANNGINNTTAFNHHGSLPASWTGGPPGMDSPANWQAFGDGDSVIAKTPFPYPDEQHTYTIEGKVINVRNITPTPYDGGTRVAYLANVSRVLPALMGCRTGTITSGGFSTWAESWAKDPGGVLTSGGEQRNFGTAHSRMIYLHPNGGGPNATGPSGNYAIDVLRRGLLSGNRVLTNVAGHALIKWVYPWELYAAR